MTIRNHSGKIRLALGLIGAYVLVYCGPSIPIKFPQYPQGTGTQLRAVLDGKRNIGVIAAPAPQAVLNQIGFQNDWSATVEAAVETEIIKKGFYSVVDISSRKERLRELAHSQSGLTQEAHRLGLEQQVDQMLVVRMTQAPRAQCRLVNKTDYTQAALNLALSQADNSRQQESAEKPTAVLYLTVFVQGKIVSVETGRSVSYAYSSPYEFHNSVGDTNCPAELAAFDPALKGAAKALAENLSPTVVTLDVPLLDDADDVEERDQENVSGFLNSGNEWAEATNFEQAARDWRRALSESGGGSTSALWNLAVYNWYLGEYDEADRFFQRAMDSAGPSWMDSSKRLLYGQFIELKNEAQGRR